MALDDGTEQPFRALFDSGALQASYISKDFLEEIREGVKDRIRPCQGVIYLADGETNERCKEEVTLLLRFKDSKGKWHISEETLVAITSPQQIILGLPSLVLRLLPVFQDMLQTAAAAAQPLNQITVEDLGTLPPKYPAEALISLGRIPMRRLRRSS